jgi:uncharacterized protein
MSQEVLRGICRNILCTDAVSPNVEVAFHCGEPLLASINWFERMYATFQELVPPAINVQYTIQTNGTLINRNWACFFKKHNFKVGVSLDGPKGLHDMRRTNWSGHPTFENVKSGINALREQDVSYSILCVLAKESLAQADELFSTFCELAPHTVAFNIEEIEGVNKGTSVIGEKAEAQLLSFFQRYWKLTIDAGFPHRVREFDHFSEACLSALTGNAIANLLTTPFCCVSVATNGDVATFSPELLEMGHPQLGDFIIGNVLTDSLSQCAEREKFAKLNNEVQSGVEKCAATCHYFPFCGGGAPSNKHAEWGSANTAETSACRHSVQRLVDVTIDRIFTAIT